jgi:hypothetical protein
MPIYRPFPEPFSSDDAGGGTIAPPFPAFKAEDVPVGKRKILTTA